MFPFNIYWGNYSSRFTVQTDTHSCSLYHGRKTMDGLTMGLRQCPYICTCIIGKLHLPSAASI